MPGRDGSGMGEAGWGAGLVRSGNEMSLGL